MQGTVFSPGGPENLSVGEVPMPGQPEGREVLLTIIFSAINRADTLQRKGLYPPPKGASEILGLEAAGRVKAVGPACKRWKVGDRVMALLPGGGNAEYVLAHEDLLIAIPDWMTMRDAAAIPEVWLTAYQILHFIGGVSTVKSTDTVLIHAGGSGVGTAAVQMAARVGATVIVTAGSQEKIDLAIKLGAAAGFNYKLEDFGEKVIEFTKGKGVNVILDCVGASHWDKNVKSISMDGRWVLYGLMGGPNISGDVLRQILGKRIAITGTTLRTRTVEYKKELIDGFTENILPHFKDSALVPVISTEFPLQDISKAHQMMEDNVNAGKILLSVRPKDSAHQEL